MKLKMGLAAIAFVVGATGFAMANQDIIDLRKQIMKTNGQAAKVSGMMLQGQIPFDATVAAAAASSIAGSNAVFADFFPEGTETGDTKARDTIWSDPEGFAAASQATVVAAEAAAAAAADGPEAFGAAFQALGATCGACHEDYRVN
ncbi:c-type cytochrome [Bauldia sp.]|uniref:c-type cytochrome n=1 Tax=Bauldia sp. TaxID=2575872 RepID=UPI003BA91A98